MDNNRIYDKQPLSIAEQIDRSKGLGLHFEDEQNAEKTLSEVSYFRFVAYLRPLEADKTSHLMKPNATPMLAVRLRGAWLNDARHLTPTDFTQSFAL